MEVHQQEERHWNMMTNYVRNARAVGILWGFFTICYVIINIVVFIQPQWIGDVEGGSTTGFFGLYRYCIFTEQKFTCPGSFYEFDEIISAPFKAASVIVGISILVIFLCILCFLLFLIIDRASIVYIICGILQFISGVLMFLGCVIYPAGWDNPEVMKVCQNSGTYQLGSCEIRYAYILAIIAIFDALILAALAFVLAARQVNKKKKQPHYVPDYRTTRSEMMYETESKPSIAIQPVLTAPSDHGADHYSEYTATSTKRSKHDFAL